MNSPAISIGLRWLATFHTLAPQGTPPIQPPTIDVQALPAIQVPLPRQADRDAPNAPLSADEAARIALRRQPSLGLARAAIDSAAGRTSEARSGLLPQLGVISTYNRIDTFKGSGSSSSTTSGTRVAGFQSNLTLNQLIFDFNRTRSAVRQAEALERSTEHGLGRAESDLVLQVKQAFYTLVQDRGLTEVARANLTSRQHELDLAQARLNSGLGAPADVVRAKTSLDDATQSLSLAENAELIARITLASAMGIDPRTPLVAAPTSELSVNVDAMNALVDVGLQRRPDLLQAREALAAAGYGVEFARTGNAPALGLSLGLGSRGAHDAFATSTGSVGLNLTWTIGDSGNTAGRIKEAKAGVDAAQATVQQIALAVVADVTQAYVNLTSARQRSAVADAQVANAEEGARLAEGRYRSGVATFVEVTDAQAALVGAQTSRVNARAGIDQALAQLARATGDDLTNLRSPALRGPSAKPRPHRPVL